MKIVKILILGVLVLSINGYSSLVLFAQDRAETTLSLGVSVPNCELPVRLNPEKRITQNYNLRADIGIYGQMYSTASALNEAGQVSVETDTGGFKLLALCGNNGSDVPFLVPGKHDIYVNGESHLLKKYTVNITSDNLKESNPQTLRLGDQDPLLAGETSIIFDNKINSLDISTQIQALYSSDRINDLNRDEKVNSLDLANTVTNFYLIGDEQP